MVKDGVFTIGLDIDNVLNACAEWFVEYAAEHFDIDVELGTRTAYNWSDYITAEQEAEILNQSHLHFGHFRPRQIAVEFLRRVHVIANRNNIKVRFIYVTDRRFLGFPYKELLKLPPREETYQRTLDWLLYNGFPVHELYLEGDMGGKTKGEIAVAENVDIFIEDAVHKAMDISQHLRRIFDSVEPVWLMLMPWNRTSFLDALQQDVMPPGIRYVKDWSEIMLLLLHQWQEFGVLEKNELDALEAYRQHIF